MIDKIIKKRAYFDIKIIVIQFLFYVKKGGKNESQCRNSR